MLVYLHKNLIPLFHLILHHKIISRVGKEVAPLFERQFLGTFPFFFFHPLSLTSIYHLTVFKKNKCGIISLFSHFFIKFIITIPFSEFFAFIPIFLKANVYMNQQSWCATMTKNLTLEDLIRIFSEDIIPAEIDKKLVMKHFEIAENRIIGERSIEKIKSLLMNSIEAARAEQFKDKGGVISSPIEILAPKAVVHKDTFSTKTETVLSPKEEPQPEQPQKEDKYGLESIRKGLVSQRLNGTKPVEKEKSESQIQPKKSFVQDKSTPLPSVEDLTVLSGGSLSREHQEEGSHDVQREIAIREYQVKDENRSLRWGKEVIKNREGFNQEINNPAYIFHSDLWQFENLRDNKINLQCDILKHAVLDMVANNINVVMLENEVEPFFVVEGFGLLYSKDSLKDKIQMNELIQLVVISSDVWQIALKRPETMLRESRSNGSVKTHTIDMTSVIPLAEVRTKIVDYDNQFKIHFDKPDAVLNKTLRTLQNHRKNVIWSCGAQTIKLLRETIKKHRVFIENPTNEINIVIIGSQQAVHPLKIKFNHDGDISLEELFPGYCRKHFILSETAIKNIFGSIPAIFGSQTGGSSEGEIAKIASSVYRRLGYSALEAYFDPGYIPGNPCDMIPISKIDIFLPPVMDVLEEKLTSKGIMFLV